MKNMKKFITDVKELFALLNLDPILLADAKRATQLFPLRFPRHWLSLVEKGNVNDPLLQQVLPLNAEFHSPSDYSTDPLNEQSVNPIPGLLHKYYGRVLLTVTGSCGVHCRYCFRRSFPYDDNNPGRAGWAKVADYIAKDASITEVILSGGDPLMAPDLLLKNLTDKLQAVPHIKTLRIHTRMPIVEPERITPQLLAWLKQLPWRVVIVVHCNHANEIDIKVKRKLNALKKTGAVLLNQTVLLKNINDNAKTLINLSEQLFDAGVLPYYLHMLDKVKGSAHFAVHEKTAKQLIAQLREKLPGYLVPRLVKEIAGEKSKVIIL